MHGGRKHGTEISGVKSSRRPRHTRGCSGKEEEGFSPGVQLPGHESDDSFTSLAEVKNV
jgi:hypothetical protein